MLEICLLEAFKDCQNIVTLEGYYQNDKDYFLVLELFDFSLDNWIFHAKQPQFDEVEDEDEELYEWCQQRYLITRDVVNGLSVMHGRGANGVLHRDLKPPNILLLGSTKGVQKAVLTDFGFARTAWNNRNRRMSAQIGTVRYMAPEIIKGEVYGKASDMWYVWG